MNDRRFVDPAEQAARDRAAYAAYLRDAAHAHVMAGDADPAKWGIQDDVAAVRTWDSRVVRQTSRPDAPPADAVCGARHVLYPDDEAIPLQCGKRPHDWNVRHQDAVTGHEWGDDDG